MAVLTNWLSQYESKIIGSVKAPSECDRPCLSLIATGKTKADARRRCQRGACQNNRYELSPLGFPLILFDDIGRRLFPSCHWTVQRKLLPFSQIQKSCSPISGRTAFLFIRNGQSLFCSEKDNRKFEHPPIKNNSSASAGKKLNPAFYCHFSGARYPAWETIRKSAA